MTAALRRTGAGTVVSALAVVGATLLVSGCTFNGAASIPLPGGVGTGSDAYQVTVEFTDVLDLVPQSAVKVADVTVGSVQSIEVKGFTARVVVRVKDDVRLPGNATASLRQTSLLGEKFVSLDPAPGVPPVGRLRDGDTIGLDRTTRGAEVEEVLGALSLVLNGGSLEQLQTINRELVLALRGREDKVKDLLTQLDTFVGGLDAQKQDIVRALDGLDRLTARLAAQRTTLSTALRDISPGVKVLADQRSQLTEVLTGLERLGTVATRVIDASQQNTVADLKALEPILRSLNAAGKDLPDSLELLTTYPFPKTVAEGIKGDFANLFVTADINLKAADNTGVLPVPLPTLPPLPVPLPSLPVKAPVLPQIDPSLPGLAERSSATTQGGLLRLLLGGLS